MVIDAFLACLFIVHYLIFLSMVREYAYFFMNIFGNWSICCPLAPCCCYAFWTCQLELYTTISVLTSEIRVLRKCFRLWCHLGCVSKLSWSVQGSMTTVEFLLLNGAKVDIRDGCGQGPLHHATQLGHTGFVCSFVLLAFRWVWPLADPGSWSFGQHKSFPFFPSHLYSFQCHSFLFSLSFFLFLVSTFPTPVVITKPVPDRTCPVWNWFGYGTCRKK